MKLLKRYWKAFKWHLKRSRIYKNNNKNISPINLKKGPVNGPIINNSFDYSKEVLYPSKQVIDLTLYLKGDSQKNPPIESNRNRVLQENESLYMLYIKYLIENFQDGAWLPTRAETEKHFGSEMTEKKLKTIKKKLLEKEAVVKPKPNSRKLKINMKKLKELK